MAAALDDYKQLRRGGVSRCPRSPRTRRGQDGTGFQHLKAWCGSLEIRSARNRGSFWLRSITPFRPNPPRCCRTSKS